MLGFLLLVFLLHLQPTHPVLLRSSKPSFRSKFPIITPLSPDSSTDIQSLYHSDVEATNRDQIHNYKLNTQHASIEDTSDSMEFIHRLRKEAKTHQKFHNSLHVALPLPPPPTSPAPVPSPLAKPMPLPPSLSPSPLPLVPSPTPAPAPTPGPVVVVTPLPAPASSCPVGTSLVPCNVCTYIGSTSLITECDTRGLPHLNIGSDIVLINTSIPNKGNSSSSSRGIEHQPNVLMATFVVDPHTSQTITMGAPYYNMNNVGHRTQDDMDTQQKLCGIHFCTSNQEQKTCETKDVENNLYRMLDPCVQLLDGSVFVRTSSSWTTLGVRTGDTIRIDKVDYVVETPRDDSIVTISHPWTNKINATFTNRTNNVTNNNCTSVAYKRSTITGNDKNIITNHPTMPCCISTSKGSRQAKVAGRLSKEIRPSQIIRIRDEIFRIEKMSAVDESATDPTLTVLLSSPSKRTSCQGMIPRLIDTCVLLPGIHATLSLHSTTVITTSIDDNSSTVDTPYLDSHLHTGDRIYFDNPYDMAHSHSLGISTWEVGAGGVTADGFEMTEPWTSPFLTEEGDRTGHGSSNKNNGTLMMYKCIQTTTGPSPTCDPVMEDDMQENRCQDVTMVRGEVEVNVESQCDLTGKIDIGDEIQLCGVVYRIVTFQKTTITLNRPWMGRPSDSYSKRPQQCTICRRPTTEAQEIMQEYQEKYGRCDSVLCMARLEAEERKLGQALDQEEKTSKRSIVEMEKEEEENGGGNVTELVVEEDSTSAKDQHGNKGGNDGGAGGGAGSGAGDAAGGAGDAAGGVAPPPSPFGDLSIPVPDATIGPDGSIKGGVDDTDEDGPLLNAIKGPLGKVLNEASKGKDDASDKKKSSLDLPDELPSKDNDAPKDDDDDEEDEEPGDDMDDGLDEDGSPTDSANGDTTPPPPGGSSDPNMPKYEKDPAFDGWKPSKVPPGSSKSFKRFMKCELCGKDNDVLNPLLMVNPSGEPPMSSEEYMKKKSKSAETMAAQSTFPGYVGIPNLPHLATATEASSNSGLGIKYCPDDWLDLGVGEHVYPIDPDNPVGHKCKNLLNIGKCKEPDALIVDLAVGAINAKGEEVPRETKCKGSACKPGTFTEDFTKKKYKGWSGKYRKCKFALKCRAPWKGFDHLCGVTRWWLKQTSQNSYHKFNDANGAENPVKWPE